VLVGLVEEALLLEVSVVVGVVVVVLECDVDTSVIIVELLVEYIEFLVDKAENRVLVVEIEVVAKKSMLQMGLLHERLDIQVDPLQGVVFKLNRIENYTYFYGYFLGQCDV